jgi:hypothetical protein
MCVFHFACDLIESKPIGAYIILTDSLASIEGLKSTGISYRTYDMKETNGPMYWHMRDRSLELCFKIKLD